MKVRLLRDARINHKAGDTVDVSPAQFRFLVSLGSAEPVKEEPPKKKTRKAAE